MIYGKLETELPYHVTYVSEKRIILKSEQMELNLAVRKVKFSQLFEYYKFFEKISLAVMVFFFVATSLYLCVTIREER